ncbi:MAG: DUF3127 domain-containing protein [Bacteroidales bacterium]|jgi:hypothetical protein|nr:DUF3127 domain-containing protein [Bacteroidales bacterium]
MALEIIGKVQQILAPQSGIGRNGAWSKREFIIETLEQYPRKVCMSVWGEKVDTIEQQYPVGTLVKVSINIESREYNGKWYTDVRAWKIDPATMEETQPENVPFIVSGTGGDNTIGPTFVDEEMDEILPF